MYEDITAWAALKETGRIKNLKAETFGYEI
jgi:hypothetical protein